MAKKAPKFTGARLSHGVAGYDIGNHGNKTQIGSGHGPTLGKILKKKR